jgi:hypothetical protein
MKTLDGIKKLNAVKKADGELLIEAIDLKELKGAKERDLAEAFLTAIEGIPEKDEQFIPEELAELYNKLAEETAPEPEAEKEVAKPAKAAKKSEVKATAKPAAKTAKKPEVKEVAKPAAKVPVKASEKKSHVTDQKKSTEKKSSGRAIMANLVDEAKHTEEALIAAAIKLAIPEKIAKMYLRAWKKDDRVPGGKKFHVNKEKIVSFK